MNSTNKYRPFLEAAHTFIIFSKTTSSLGTFYEVKINMTYVENIPICTLPTSATKPFIGVPWNSVQGFFTKCC